MDSATLQGINQYKKQFYLYILELYKTKIKETIPFTIASKTKILRKKFNKEIARLVQCEVQNIVEENLEDK
jgi:hypothetical protein